MIEIPLKNLQKNSVILGMPSVLAMVIKIIKTAGWGCCICIAAVIPARLCLTAWGKKHPLTSGERKDCVPHLQCFHPQLEQMQY